MRGLKHQNTLPQNSETKKHMKRHNAQAHYSTVAKWLYGMILNRKDQSVPLFRIPPVCVVES
jgi:hypothetical protein